MLRFVPLVLACLLVPRLTPAQGISLEKAVELAVSRSLVIQNGQLDRQFAQSQLLNSQLARLPQLNGSVSAAYQFGLNQDPTTGILVNQVALVNNYSLDAGIQLFTGGRIKNAIGQARTRVAASEASVSDLTQQVSLETAQAYLNALLAEDELRSGTAQLRDAEQQLARIDARIRVGSSAAADRYSLDSDVARQEQQVTAARNTVDLRYLQLRQLLRLDSNETLALARIDSISDIEVSIPDASGDEIFRRTLQTQPSIKAARLNEAVAERQIDIAKSAYYPTLSAFGQLNTRYNSEGKRGVPGESVFVDQEIILNGTNTTIQLAQPGQPIRVGIPFKQQVQDFFGQAVGLSLNVPILNNGQVIADVQSARIQYEQATVQSEQARLQLEIDVQQAYQAAVSARDEVTAAARAFAAAEAAYNAAGRRLEVGAGSTYDVSNAQILREQAGITLLRARYQYLFNAKVLQFYLGEPLTLD